MEKDFTKFREEGSKYLSTWKIKKLRIYGRKMGVFRPTDRSKSNLIEQIIGIWTGEIEPIEPSKRGAPVKEKDLPPEIHQRMSELYDKYVKNEGVPYEEKRAHYLPPRINRLWEFNDPSAPRVEYVNGQQAVYKGQLYFYEGKYMLLPLNFMDGRQQYVERQVAEKYGLEEGDVVTFFGKYTENGIYATEIVTINDTAVENFKRRIWDDLFPCYPFERIRFYNEETGEPQDNTAKYLQWLFPIGQGHRTCVFGAPKSGKSTILCKIAQYARQYNNDLKVFVALIDQAPEEVGKYRKFADKENLVFASYEDEPERQIFLADFMLARAKAYAESGKNALLILDSIGGLARAYNETDESSGGKVLSCGLESKTLRYVKKFLGAGRCFEEGGSLTVVAALTTDTGSPIDDLLEKETSEISNARIHLSNRLAISRIYPAIDYQKTEIKDCGLLQISEEIELQKFIRNEYVPQDDEGRLFDRLEESHTYAQFKENVYKK